MWYCAHAIFYFKYERQESFLLHENVYLIEAGMMGGRCWTQRSLPWRAKI